MSSLNRRSLLSVTGIALGAGLGGCLGDVGSDTTDEPTDSPMATSTPGGACRGRSSDYSWKTSGSWYLDITVNNHDEIPYQITVSVIHHGSEPCHHAETTPCQSPEKYETPFEQTVDLEATESKTFTDTTLGLWNNWIDDYTVQVAIEADEMSSWDRVFAYEKGAQEPIGTDTYEEADFYVCDGTERTINTVISDGLPQLSLSVP